MAHHVTKLNRGRDGYMRLSREAYCSTRDSTLSFVDFVDVTEWITKRGIAPELIHSRFSMQKSHAFGAQIG